MAITPYVTFNGNCREAFDFYRSVFGGEFGLVLTFRDGPEDMGVQQEDLDLLMHISLPIGSGVLLGSDNMSAHRHGLIVGTNVALSFDARDREHADEIFAGLSAGGEVHMPMADMFWGAYFGAVMDKFGIQWQVSAEH